MRTVVLSNQFAKTPDPPVPMEMAEKTRKAKVDPVLAALDGLP